jgi:3-hydroxyisobutyrate dehydrogenase-like beta-hydroxyacid dehydrogenase
MTHDLALIGFGEAGSAFAAAAKWGRRACAWDIAPARQNVMQSHDLSKACDPRAALSDTPLVLSLVTADQALEAAKSYAPFLSPEAIWCDMNSVAPDTKRAAANIIEAAGARYVDVAVLAPVEPARLAVPLLLSGAAAEPASAALAAAGFGNIRVVGDIIGRASAVKMIRSIMVKGIEALTDEMMAAAEAAGVAAEVLASLDASETARRWGERAHYNLERMRTHGARRAAEMDEVALTLEALGIEPLMTRAAARRQHEAGERG